MSDSDNDSANEEKKSSKGSSKSSKKNRRMTDPDFGFDNDDNNEEGEPANNNGKTARKKKSRRRTSASVSVASETEPSDAEAGADSKKSGRSRSKSKSTRIKRKQSREGIDAAPEPPPVEAMESMLTTIKKNRQANINMTSNNNGDLGPEKTKVNRRVGMHTSKRTSFSGSTIQRDVQKKATTFEGDNSLMRAMGKIPPPSVVGEGDNGSDSDEHDGAGTEEAKAPAQKKRLSFRPVSYGSDEDEDIGRKVPSRSSSMSSLNDSLQHLQHLQRNKPPQAMNGAGGGLRQPSRQNSLMQRSRRATPGSSIQGSLTAQRPGITRRNSMTRQNSLTMGSKGIYDENGDLDQNNLDRRSSMMMRAAQSVAFVPIKQHKQQRRLQMSMVNQTYIPPKSRQTSLFQAVMHAMAGRMVDLTLWMYQASFLKVLLFFLAFYITNIFIWAMYRTKLPHACPNKLF